VTDLWARLEQYYAQNRTALIRGFLRYGPRDVVEDAVQEAMVRIFARYDGADDEPPENLNPLMRTAIRNILIDGIRRPTTVPIGQVRSGADGQPEMAPPVTDAEEGEFDGDPPLLSREVAAEDQTAWKDLLRSLLDELEPKWHNVICMMMLGHKPTEIGAIYQQNGYVLTRHARALLCRAAARLAQVGDPLAAMLEGDWCRRKAA
jgi:RNA polymerase sigma factor (sigma-70 family)